MQSGAFRLCNILEETGFLYHLQKVYLGMAIFRNVLIFHCATDAKVLPGNTVDSTAIIGPQ